MAVLNDLGGDAAEEKPGNGPQAFGTRDEQIDFLPIGHFDDFIGRVPEFQHAVHGVPGFDEALGIAIEKRLTGLFHLRIA